MYLEHFQLQELPFSLTPNTQFYCDLPSHREALNVILISLRNGDGFIKITGEVGVGKTLLCRLLLKELSDEYVTAYLPNPDLTPHAMRHALAQELGVVVPPNTDAHTLIELINSRLLSLNQQGKRVVLLIDEAQALPQSCMETLRLLTNLETETTKLLQIVLFGQPELNVRLQQEDLRQLRQRIIFSYELKRIHPEQLLPYLRHRLAKAGYTFGELFTPKARRMLWRASTGIPRLINILAHKALIVSYGLGTEQVDHRSMMRAIVDTESVYAQPSKTSPRWFYVGVGFFLAMLLLALVVSL